MVNSFNVEYSPEAINDLKKIDKAIAQRILDKIKWLSNNFPYITPQSLRGNMKNFYKLRAGDWRVIYTVDLIKKTIRIHMVGHRSEIYK